MQATILPIAAGWLWIAQGCQLFLRQPIAFFMWAGSTATLIMASYLMPILGQMLLIAAAPALTFITLNACHHIANGHTMRLGMWLTPLRPVGGKLFTLGLAYLVCCLAGGFLAVLPFSDQLLSVMATDYLSDAQALAALSQVMAGPLTLFFVLYLIISALFWHAPALIGWHGLPLSRALFFSMVACWRNKWPFLLYGVSWVAIFFAMPLLASLLHAVGLATTVVQSLLVPTNILVFAMLYCSFYPTYISVFGASVRVSNAV